jgi:flagellar M-ring protein FliF
MAEATLQTLPAPASRAWPIIAPQHIGLMLTAATLIALLVAGYLWSQAPEYRVLYGNLPERDGGAVVTALQQMNVPYKFADGGALMVPSGQIHESRLRLAAQGLPKAGPQGFELMESQKFGVSQFAEQINYQRALEGELARTIQTLSSVQAARVHLALSKPSAFMREQAKASASVLLNLAPGRTLDSTQVSAVIHLVSNSVPELQAKNVSIVDQNGNLLSSDNGNNSGRPSLDPNQLKYRQSLEQNYIARIESIVAPLIGAANVRAQVTAELDFTESEHAEEIHKPNQDAANATIRSQQLSESSASRAGGAAGGVPGALTNQPPAAATAPITAPATAPASAATGTAPAPADTRKDSTVNYEVDKTIRHTRQELGRIKRLAVAVVVNHKKQVSKAGKVSYSPLAEADINQITNLVKEVMAFDKERGDTVSVANSAFNIPEKEILPEVPLWKQPDVIETAKMIGKNLLIAAILLFVVLRVLRPMLKTFAAATSAQRELQQLPQEAAGGPPQLQSFEQNVDRAKQIARQDPKAVANVVKEWVDNNGK